MCENLANKTKDLNGRARLGEELEMDEGQEESSNKTDSGSRTVDGDRLW